MSVKKDFREMKKFVGKAMADKNAQDLYGVIRGLHRVQKEIISKTI